MTSAMIKRNRVLKSARMSSFLLSTWNCFGMGQNALDVIFGRRAPHGARFRHQGVISECTSNDVFCIQELLSTEACDFFDALKTRAFPASIRDDNRAHFRSATMRGTGLGIGTRLPLLEHRFHRFQPRAVGWDRFARKGALHARVQRSEGREVDVLTAHLQAGGNRAAAETRKYQLEELHALIAQLAAPDRSFIVCGDLNIDGLKPRRDEGEYSRLIQALEGFIDLGAVEDLPTLDPKIDIKYEANAREQRLDYIFYRPAQTAAGGGMALRSIRRMLDRPLPPEGLTHAYASDHFGLIAEFSDEAPQ